MTAEQDLADALAAYEQQWRDSALASFDERDAWTLGEALYRRGIAEGVPIVVDVRRDQQQLFHAACPGSTADNDTWVARKSAVARRFGVPSLLVGYRYRIGGRDFNEATALSFQEYAAHGGAVPVLVRGTGAVAIATVSGLKSEDDHAWVIDALGDLARG